METLAKGMRIHRWERVQANGFLGGATIAPHKQTEAIMSGVR